MQGARGIVFADVKGVAMDFCLGLGESQEQNTLKIKTRQSLKVEEPNKKEYDEDITVIWNSRSY